MKSWLRDLPAAYRLALLALLAVGTCGAARFAPAEIALHWQAGAGYWIVLAAFVIWVWLLAQVLPAAWRAFAWQPADRWGLLALPGFGAVLLLPGTHGFQLPAVEFDLLGTSMAMHWQRVVFLPQQGGEVNGVFELLAGTANTRPLFFPFLLSVLHDVTGYRPENAFVLNGALTLLLLGLSYVAGRALAGWKGGLFAMLAWTALPLLGRSATGGGADLLHVVMILTTSLLAGWHWRVRDDASLGALVFAGILLSQTLFASSVFLLGVGLTTVLVWTEQRGRSLPWIAVLSPLFLLPLALLHRVLAEVPGAPAFSVGHISVNLGHALAHWFHAGTGRPNSLLLSASGLLALAAALVLLPSSLRQWRTQAIAHRAACIFLGATLLYFFLLMGFSWARLDDPAFHRLNLPVHLLFALSPVLVWTLTPRFRHVPNVALSLAALALISSSLSGLRRQNATPLPPPVLDAAWRREFIHRQPEPDYLVLDRDPRLWLTHRITSTPVEQARSNPGSITAALRDRHFSTVYVFQTFYRDTATGALRIHPDDDLGPTFALEKVSELNVSPDQISRLSRLVATPPVRAASTPQSATRPAMRPADIPMDDWIRKLP